MVQFAFLKTMRLFIERISYVSNKHLFAGKMGKGWKDTTILFIILWINNTSVLMYRWTGERIHLKPLWKCSHHLNKIRRVDCWRPVEWCLSTGNLQPALITELAGQRGTQAQVNNLSLWSHPWCNSAELAGITLGRIWPYGRTRKMRRRKKQKGKGLKWLVVRKNKQTNKQGFC